MLDVQSLLQYLPASLWSSLTMLGHGGVLFALLALAWRQRPEWLAAAFLTLPIASIYTHGLKALINSPRPAAVVPAEQLQVIGERLLSGSFPSGHTVSAFTLAAIILFSGKLARHHAVLVLLLALLVGLSRIAVGAHWPTDVLAGAAGGWLSGALGVWLAGRCRWIDGKGVQQVLAVTVLITAMTLFFSHAGYPQGVAVQYFAATFGTLAALRWLAAKTP